MVSLGLGLPSLATALGGPGDLRAWRELQQEQAEYLVQVRQPGDLLPFVVRDLATAANLTNAAVLYDHTFSKNCFLFCRRLNNKVLCCPSSGAPLQEPVAEPAGPSPHLPPLPRLGPAAGRPAHQTQQDGSQQLLHTGQPSHNTHCAAGPRSFICRHKPSGANKPLTALWLRQVATRDLMMYGEKFAWFAGTKHSGAQLDHTCCKEIDVRRNSRIV